MIEDFVSLVIHVTINILTKFVMITSALVITVKRDIQTLRMRCNYNKKNASDEGKINALKKKFTKKLQALENQVGEMKKLLAKKDSEINDIKNKYNDMDELLKEFQSFIGKIEERFLHITQHNETVVELKKEIEDKD